MAAARFVDLWLAREVETKDVEAFAANWHRDHYTQRVPKEMTPLSDYLGLTLDEYYDWVEDKRPLEDILLVRRGRIRVGPEDVRVPTREPEESENENEDYGDYGD